MWLPKTAHQYVVSVMRCWYGQIPHWLQAALAQHTGLVAEMMLPSYSGARPTAAYAETPGSIEVTAPGRVDALSAVCPSTYEVEEPYGTSAPAAAKAWAWSGGSCGGISVSASAGGAEPRIPARAARSIARSAVRRTDIVTSCRSLGGCGGHASVARFDNKDGSLRQVRSRQQRHEISDRYAND